MEAYKGRVVTNNTWWYKTEKLSEEHLFFHKVIFDMDTNWGGQQGGVPIGVPFSTC